MNRTEALSRHLREKVLISHSYGDNVFETEGNHHYLVLKEEEVEGRVKEEIEGLLWAFSPSYLADFTRLPEQVFTCLAGLCESGNEAILEIVGNRLDELVRDSISSDGAGHFLSPYDGEEIELSGNYYAYQL